MIFVIYEADSSSAASVITTKSFLGLCHDPFHDQRFASFSDDGEIRVWDTRKLTYGPVVTITSGSKTLTDVAWSTQRPNLLASISKEDDFVSFWELQNQAATIALTDADRVKDFDLWRSSQCTNPSSIPSLFFVTLLLIGFSVQHKVQWFP